MDVGPRMDVFKTMWWKHLKAFLPSLSLSLPLLHILYAVSETLHTLNKWAHFILFKTQTLWNMYVQLIVYKYYLLEST